MEKYFVNYTQALTLKELRFDKECLGVYLNNKLTIEDDWLYSTNDETFIESDNVTAPLKSQAFEFFREKFGFDISILGFENNDYRHSYAFCISDRHRTLQDYKFDSYITFSYIEVEENCIDELIKLAKEKRKNDLGKV